MNDSTKAIVSGWCTALAAMIVAFVPRLTIEQKTAVYAFVLATGSMGVLIYGLRHAGKANSPPPPPPPPADPTPPPPPSPQPKP